MQPRPHPRHEPRHRASDRRPQRGTGRQQEERDQDDHHALQPRKVSELHSDVLRHDTLGGAHEERDHFRAFESLAEPAQARRRIDLLDAQVIRVREVHHQLGGRVGQPHGPVPVLGVHGKDRAISHLVKRQ